MNTRITRTGFVHTKEHFGFPCHSHGDEHEFHLFTRGGGAFQNGEKQHHIQGVTLVFTPKGVPHQKAPMDSPKDLWFIFVTVCYREHQPLFEGGWAIPGDPYLQLFEKILHLQTDQNREKHRVTEMYMDAIIEDIKTGERSFHKKQNVYIDHMIRRIRESVYSGLRLDHLARELGINKSYMIRLFKHHVGETPGRYHIRLKVETARHLLLHDNLTLHSIAKELGFYDEYHLSKTYKRIIGVSPQKHRREHSDGVK